MSAPIGISMRPPLQICPMCRLAMMALKSRPDSADYGIYECLACETELALSGDSEPSRAKRSWPVRIKATSST